jgi:glycosyltransferase 2 family protein
MTRQQLGLLLRIAVSVIGIGLVVWTVNIEDAVSSLLSVNPAGFILAVVIFQLGIVIRAARWWVLLRPHAAHLPFWKLVRLYYVGMFFNLFLPTGFGGDVVRAAELGTEVDGATSAATVLLDRMLGLMALFAIALVAAPFVAGMVPGQLLLVTSAVSLVGLVGGLMVLHGQTFAFVLRLTGRVLGRLPLMAKVLGALTKFNDAISLVGRDTGAVGQAFGISLLFNGTLILIHVVLSEALALDVPWVAYIVVVPLTSILLLVPSIAGIGLRESGMVGLLAGFTDDLEKGAALGFAVLLQNIISGVIGWVWYIVYSLQKRTAANATPAPQQEVQ